MASESPLRIGYTTLSAFVATVRDEANKRRSTCFAIRPVTKTANPPRSKPFWWSKACNLNFEDRVQRNYTATMLEGYHCK